MRFFPFGSGSVIVQTVSASYADYSIVADRAILAVSASVTVSGSQGPQGDPGNASTFHGPYDQFPPV